MAAGLPKRHLVVVSQKASEFCLLVFYTLWRSFLEMLSDRSSALTLVWCRPSARKSLGRSQKRFQLLTKSSFWSLHHDNNHLFKANNLLKLLCPRRHVGRGPDMMIRRCAAYRLDQAPEVPLQCLRLPQLGVIHPGVQHDRSKALVAFQDRWYLHRNIENMSTRGTVSVHFNFS